MYLSLIVRRIKCRFWKRIMNVFIWDIKRSKGALHAVRCSTQDRWEMVLANVICVTGDRSCQTSWNRTYFRKLKSYKWLKIRIFLKWLFSCICGKTYKLDLKVSLTPTSYDCVSRMHKSSNSLCFPVNIVPYSKHLTAYTWKQFIWHPIRGQVVPSY